MYAKTEAEKETTNNQNLAVKDEFLVIKCSTCEAFSIEYRTYKGHKMVIQGTGIPEKTKTNIDSKDAGFWEFELDKSTIFPFTSSPENVPVIVQDDYKLMHLCYQVGSSQGLAVHCRRILEKIFSQFESKYLTKKEKIENRDIKERAKIIAQKCVYFQGINNTLRNLQGVVSTIIHTSQDKLAFIDDLKINEEAFDDIKQILEAILKVHDLEFNTLPKLDVKYKISKETGKEKP